MTAILLFLLMVTERMFSVTNLNDSGSGSLRECVEAKGSRACVFEVSGTIPLKSNLVISDPDIGIYGQTSPGPIELRGAGLHISASDVILSHIAIRPGDSRTGTEPATRDALQITSYKTKKPISNVIVDHCSFTWAVDENVDLYGNNLSNIQITNSIIAEPLYRSIHPKGPHGMGLLINSGAKNVLLMGNLFAHNYDRNPRVKDGVTLQFINNAVYNWGGKGCWNSGLNLSSSSKAQGSLINFVGNLYKPGKSSPKRNCPSIYNDSTVPRSTKIFVKDNRGPSITQTDWSISGLPSSMQSVVPLLPLPKKIIPSSELTDYIVANVGPQPKNRSKTDARIVEEFKFGTGDIKDCVSGCVRNTE